MRRRNYHDDDDATDPESDAEKDDTETPAKTTTGPLGSTALQESTVSFGFGLSSGGTWHEHASPRAVEGNPLVYFPFVLTALGHSTLTLFTAPSSVFSRLFMFQAGQYRKGRDLRVTELPL